MTSLSDLRRSDLCRLLISSCPLCPPPRLQSTTLTLWAFPCLQSAALPWSSTSTRLSFLSPAQLSSPGRHPSLFLKEFLLSTNNNQKQHVMSGRGAFPKLSFSCVTIFCACMSAVPTAPLEDVYRMGRAPTDSAHLAEYMACNEQEGLNK